MAEVNRQYDEMELRFFNNRPNLNGGNETFGKGNLLKTFVWYGKIGAGPIMSGRIMSRLLEFTELFWVTPKHRQVGISLLRLQFALEAYKREHDGNYPGKLEDLPGIEIPLDPFSGKPFRYIMEPAEDGKPGFLLYSVGPNGVDDEGRYYDDFPKGDDIRRRTSPDVVQNQPM